MSVHSKNVPGNQNRSSKPDETSRKTGDALQKVRELLDSGRPSDALHVVNSNGLRDPATQNARAVCLLRLGKADEAVNALRGAVLKGGYLLRDDVPTEYKLNMATALAMSGNAAGASTMLKEIGEPDHPQAQRLQASISRWRQTLSLPQRLKWMMGANIDIPVPVNEAPGELV